MVKLAIRDDDMNYFTKVEDVDNVYKPLQGFPISFAVIPTVTDVSTIGSCSDTRGNTIPRWVGDNMVLVNWLKDKLSKRECDVLLHGITHSYKFLDGKRYSEMQWRKELDLSKEIGDIRNKVELLLNYNITVFVAPSNKISKYGIKCVSENNLNFSGIVPLGFERDFTKRNITSYFKRWLYRVKDNLPYPNILHYSDHDELNACVMESFDYLKKMYHYCERINSPMVVNVHYWHLRDNIEIKNEFFRFIDYAINHGAQPALMSDLFRK